MAIVTVTVGGKQFAACQQTINGVTALVLLDDPGVYDYKAGIAPVSFTVPAGALLRKVSVVAGADQATVTIAAKDAITIPATMAFDENVTGVMEGPTVDIAGSVVSFYVSWVGG